MKKNFLLALLCLLFTTTLLAQEEQKESSLLWKVSGGNLKKPSYLFGTFHMLSNAFIDTLPIVREAYKASEIMVGELNVDSSLQTNMMKASLLRGTTLKQELPDSIYTRATAWFSKEAGLDLAVLDAMNPVSVMSVAMAITQQKHYPNKPEEVQLDTYFQEMAKKDGKKIIGLETIQAQIKALFGQLTLPRQASLLYQALKEDDGLKIAIGQMKTAYVSRNLVALHNLTYGSDYSPQELKVLLDDRNNHWMEQLPGLMKKQSLFVAVGALHLVGKTGLVQQLQEKGYTVTPVKL